MSVAIDPICGVRDWAAVLRGGMESRGADVHSRWWERTDGGAFDRSTAKEFRDWRSAVRRAVADLQPDVILWHYSVYTYGWRGVPLLALPVAWCLHRTGVPVIPVLHEPCRYWGHGGLQGFLQAFSQRVVLIPVLTLASGAIVTSTERQRWTTTRRWLPKSRLLCVPVSSNLPSPSAGNRERGTRLALGIFGYDSAAMRPELVMDALAILRAEGHEAQVLLIGKPGRDSEAGRRWVASAEHFRCARSVDFTEILSPQELADDISRVDLVLYPDRRGPISTKTTLAAVLAAGKCIIGLDGQETWDAIRRDAAVLLCDPSGSAIAETILAYSNDIHLRLAQEWRAAAFYQQHMAPSVVSDRIIGFVKSVAQQ